MGLGGLPATDNIISPGVILPSYQVDSCPMQNVPAETETEMADSQEQYEPTRPVELEWLDVSSQELTCMLGKATPVYCTLDRPLTREMKPSLTEISMQRRHACCGWLIMIREQC